MSSRWTRPPSRGSSPIATHSGHRRRSRSRSCRARRRAAAATACRPAWRRRRARGARRGRRARRRIRRRGRSASPATGVRVSSMTSPARRGRPSSRACRARGRAPSSNSSASWRRPASGKCRASALSTRPSSVGTVTLRTGSRSYGLEEDRGDDGVRLRSRSLRRRARRARCSRRATTASPSPAWDADARSGARRCARRARGCSARGRPACGSRGRAAPARAGADVSVAPCIASSAGRTNSSNATNVETGLPGRPNTGDAAGRCHAERERLARLHRDLAQLELDAGRLRAPRARDRDRRRRRRRW